MKFLNELLGATLVIALLAALGYGGYAAVSFLIGYFTALDETMLAYISTGWVALLGAALIVGGAVRWVRRTDQRHQQRLRKAEIYHRFIGAWACLLDKPASESEAETTQAATLLKAAEQELLLWASGGVVRSYMAFRQRENPGRGLDLSDPETRTAMEKVLQEIRRDLGQSTLGFQKGELLSLLTGSDTVANARNNPPPAEYPDRTSH